jgi:two-component system sensor histidine kinase CiaH
MFTRARIKLTAYSVAVAVCLVSIFSFALFHFTAKSIQDAVEEDTPAAQVQQRIADKGIDNLQNALIVSDVSIIVLISALAYFFAGKTLKPIQAAHDAQAQFSANASHELRTPLSVLKTENEVFLKQHHGSYEEGRKLAQSNLEEIDRMTSMVEELLLLARSSNAHTKVQFSRIDLSQIIEKVIGTYRASVREKGLALVYEPGAQILVKGNGRLLEQLFSNLIQNAINYTKKGTVTVETHRGTKVQVKIIDTGIGIAEADIPHLTKAFYKADSSRAASKSGVGLGLSIAQEIVRRHKGVLIIDSELGKGTRVSIELPLSG